MGILKKQDLQVVRLIRNRYIMSNFRPLHVVGRGSEIQLQVGEN